MTTMTGDTAAPPPPDSPMDGPTDGPMDGPTDGPPLGPPDGPTGGPAGDPGPPPPPPPGPPGRGRLTRSRDGRLVGGVAAGLGRWTDVDPVVFRVTFAVLTLFGGSGLVLYALGWLLLPEDGAPASPAERFAAGRSGGRMVAPAVAIGAAVLVLILLEGGGGFGNGEAFPVAVLVGLGVWLGVRNRTDVGPAPGWPRTAAPGPVYGPWGQATTGQGDPTAYTPQAYGATAYTPQTYGAPAYGPTGDAAVGTPTGPAYGGSAYPPAGWPAATPPHRRPKSVLGRLTLSVLLLAFGLAALLDTADVVDVSAPGAFALALVVVGAGLVVGTWYGRSRGLIVLGALLSLGLVASTSVDVPADGSTGSRVWAPVTVGELRSPYQLGAGDARLDLSGLTVETGTVRVEAEVGLGSLRVTVPDDVTVEVVAEVGAGELTVLDRQEEGFGNDLALRDEVEDSGNRRIVLDVQVGVGELEVVRAQA